MRTADFDFALPPELIAQTPAPQRDQSRLLVLHRPGAQVEHRHFGNLPDYLRPGDVLVLNNSRVIPARLRGTNARSGGQFEVLLLEENGPDDWWAMLRPGKRARVGTRITFRNTRGTPVPVQATVTDTNAEGHRRLRFECGTAGTPLPQASTILDLLDDLGEVPLPPYVTRADTTQMTEDRQRYQTVFAQTPGSVAAPTAGLHFTESLLDNLRSRGVQICFLTLHVGLGTFAPVKAETVSAHVMHEERYHLSAETARTINEAKRLGNRVVAVGTTTLRVLESLAVATAPPPAVTHPAPLVPGAGKTGIFIYPPYDFKIVDALLTNFHLPRSTLLMLASAFAAPSQTEGRDLLLSAYAEAIRQRYRFFSYGDAMLIL